MTGSRRAALAIFTAIELCPEFQQTPAIDQN
ncbi:hypothetical protein ABIG06_005983 [Bradyrhizobium sp. USDA 326]